MAIDPERVQVLFQQLIKFDMDQQDQFLDEVCQSDHELRQQLVSLLMANQERTSELAINQHAKLEATQDSQRKIAATVDSEVRDDAESTADFTLTPAAGISIHERFVLEQKIGEGGMGEVWIAKQLAPFKRRSHSS